MAAVRYTFGYRGDRIWLVDHHRVQTVAPLSGPLVDLADRSGFWCELRDRAGRVMHRQALRDPRHPTAEVHEAHEVHASRPAHVPRPEPAGVFSVLVPEPPPGENGATLALVQRRATDAAPRDVFMVPTAPPPPARR